MTTPWEWAENLSAVVSAVHALGALRRQPWAVTLRRGALTPAQNGERADPHGPAGPLTVRVTVHVPADASCTVVVVTGPGRRGRGAGR
ncbi:MULTISPECIES: hypothetical protein [unclassified Streptomyces]|uniref:hypothetical protein n=1 Tax=unclassified Streptomyces TaxID=2593676 RepID=UPI0033B67988